MSWAKIVILQLLQLAAQGCIFICWIFKSSTAPLLDNSKLYKKAYLTSQLTATKYKLQCMNGDAKENQKSYKILVPKTRAAGI